MFTRRPRAQGKAPPDCSCGTNHVTRETVQSCGATKCPTGGCGGRHGAEALPPGGGSLAAQLTQILPGAAPAEWLGHDQGRSAAPAGPQAPGDRGTPQPEAAVVQRKEAGACNTDRAGPTDPEGVRDRLQNGQPLESGVRSRMEKGFGRDFGGVRVHTDAEAAGLAAELSSRAFTYGQDVAFADQQYRPGTPYGDALIAHELAHTVQQGKRDPSRPQEWGLAHDDALEHEADRAAAQVLGGGSVHGRLAEQRGLRLQGCSQKTKACPKGHEWYPTATAQWGSLGCSCIWKCLRKPPSGGSGSGPAYTCPPGVSCSDPYERVGEDYTKTGYGSAFTPLGGEPACGCFPLDIEGENRRMRHWSLSPST